MSGDQARETSRSRRTHSPDQDPRDIVTEYAFRVDPDLLGVPLASPLRRVAGIFVDLVVLGLLFPFRAAAGALLGGVVDFLVAVAVAWVLFRLASPRTAGKTPVKAVRFLLRTTALIVALVGVGNLFGGGDGEDGPAARVATGDSVADSVLRAVSDLPAASPGSGGVRIDGRSLPFGEIAGGVREILELTRARSAAEAGPAAREVANRLHRVGASPDDVRETLRAILEREGGDEYAWTDSVVAQVVAHVDSIAREDRRQADSLVVRYGRALAAGDSVRADSLRPRLREAIAGERIERLERENERLEARLDEATRSPSLVRRGLSVLTEDLGIGLGWLGIYFVGFLAMWDGRTPGKRVAGTRVVHLDGTPIGWWDAFSRFGGYAAGIATGMLGFLQVIWDPNRQGIHDRVAGTVVIRTRGPGKES